MIIDSLAGLATWINAHAVWPNLPIWAYVTLTILDTQGAWFHVTSAQSEGWIQASAVTVPPLGSATDASTASTAPTTQDGGNVTDPNASQES